MIKNRSYKGYFISRGAYHDTTDDRTYGWYVNHIDADSEDRRGRWYMTLREAREGIRRLIRSADEAT